LDFEPETAKRLQVMVRTMFPSARWESPCARRKELLESACSTARSTSNEPTAIIAGLSAEWQASPACHLFWSETPLNMGPNLDQNRTTDAPAQAECNRAERDCDATDQPDVLDLSDPPHVNCGSLPPGGAPIRIVKCPSRRLQTGIQ